MRKLVSLISFFLLSCTFLIAEEKTGNVGGLTFLSHQVSKENRTSAYLENDEPIEFRDYFKLEFDYKIYMNKSGVFGDIFKISIGDQTITMCVNVKYVGGVHMTILKDKEILLEHHLSPSRIHDGKWSHVSFLIDPKNNDNLLIATDFSHSVLSLGKGYEKKAYIHFGANDSNLSNDVAAFAINNLSVSMKPGEILYLWNFNQHYQNYAKDVYGGKKLMVENPEWMADHHMHWYKEDQFVLPISFFLKGTQDEMRLIAADGMYVYDLNTNKLERIPNKQPLDIVNLSNTFLWNPDKQRVEYFNCDDKTFVSSYFDEEKQQWVPEILPDNKWQMQGCLMYHDNTYYHMFGYGHHTYSGRMSVFRPGQGLRKIQNDKISPRYLSATGIRNDEMYIATGVGHESGKQLLGVKIYSDFYKMNLANGLIEKKSEVKLPENETASQNMYFKEDDSFYSLFYNPFHDQSYLVLKRIFLDGREPENYCDTIPYFFNDMSSEARLYKTSSKLFAVTKHKLQDGNYEYNVYSTILPLLSASDVILTEPERNPWSWIIPVVVLLLCLAGAGVYFFFIRKKKSVESAVGMPHPDLSTMSDEAILQVGRSTANVETYGPGIYLLGGFRVINSEGSDITGEFTPVMKQLLCLIILYTVKDDRGISNTILKDTLWMDKSDESAINNRSVNIRKIRLRLSEVGSYKLSSKNSYWRFISPEDCMCDIFLAVPFLKRINASDQVSSQDMQLLLELASAGPLLPNQNFDFFDDLKSYYTTMLIDALNKVLLLTNDHFNRLSFANAIMKFSPLDESALQIKCRSLVGLGKNGLAKSAYDTFAKDYEVMMGEKFPMDFDQILKENIVN